MATNICNICIAPFTSSARRQIVCQYCPSSACRVCQQRYLLNTHEDPHCYTCKRGWSTEFMSDNFPLSFRTVALRKHRRTILLERETAMLPAMQVFVEAKNNKARAEELYNDVNIAFNKEVTVLGELRSETSKAYARYSPLRVRYLHKDLPPAAANTVAVVPLTAEEKAQMFALRSDYKTKKALEEEYYKEKYLPALKTRENVNAEIWRWQRIYNNGYENAGEARVKREFIMRCPAEGCRGFLSTAYKCGVCEKSTCSDCLECLGDRADAGHTCKPDNVESAKAIKKETRPCPKCAARIFKIDGCDQMWCTVDSCNTAFSWNTGHVATGRVHNPHYYEWLRRNGGGTAPREAGDIPCGGIPPAWGFSRGILANHHIATTEKNKLLEIHRCALDLQHRLTEFPARPPNLMNKHIDVSYLMNVITEDEWQRRLEYAEAAFNRKKEIGQILQTIVTASSDILQTVENLVNQANAAVATDKKSPAQKEAAETIRSTILPNLESLREYTNSAYKKLASSLHMAVPQIGDKWEWMGIRALYKRTPTVATVRPEANTVETVQTMEAWNGQNPADDTDEN